MKTKNPNWTPRTEGGLMANNRNLPRNRVGSRELVSLLSEWERVAFGHESVFLERFCHDAWQLAKVSWSSETMHVVYIADSGQHITDSIPLNEWLEFYEANTETSQPRGQTHE